ncbi:MAG: hypothetical protein ACTSRA_13905, partial [Promethearchaeota archaeon]
MFDWFTLLYSLFGALFSVVVDMNDIVTVNLPIILVSDGIYLLIFYINYSSKWSSSVSGVQEETRVLINRSLKIRFFLKHLILILFGMVHVLLTLALSTYILLLAGGLLKSHARKWRVKGLQSWMVPNLLGSVTYILVPLLFSVLSFILDFIACLVPIWICAAIYFFWRRNRIIDELKDLCSKETNRFHNIPTTLQYILLLLILIPLPFVLIGLYIGGTAFLEFLVMYGADITDPIEILLVNLSVVVVGRIFYLLGFYFNHSIKLYPVGDRQEGAFLSSKQHLFRLKVNNVLMLIVGTLLLPVGILISTYSLVCAGAYFKRIHESKKNITWIVLRFLSYGLIAALFLLVLFTHDLTLTFVIGGLMVGLAIIYYLLKGRKFTGFTNQELSAYLQKSKKLLSIILQYAIIIFGIALPTYIILSSSGIGMPVRETYFIGTSDGSGTILATDVYYSPLVGKKPAPVILVRTPYGKNE